LAKTLRAVLKQNAFDQPQIYKFVWPSGRYWWTSGQDSISIFPQYERDWFLSEQHQKVVAAAEKKWIEMA
jgi:hypothetical protein